MQDKFCLSPWKDNQYCDNHFYLNLNQVVQNRSNILQFSSCRQPRSIRKKYTINYNSQTVQLKQKCQKLERIQRVKNENSFRLEDIKVSHRSADITPSKGSKIHVKNLANCKNFNFGLQKQVRETSTKDSSNILIKRFLKLKKQGKLQLKQRFGQRILRF